MNKDHSCPDIAHRTPLFLTNQNSCLGAKNSQRQQENVCFICEANLNNNQCYALYIRVGQYFDGA